MKITYKQPQFTLVRTDELSRVFYSTSGTPGDATPTPAGSISSMSSTDGSW